MALTTVAVAQPLLDLLGRNAAFLVAHDATRLDVVAVAVGLTIVVPLLIAGVLVLAARLHRGLGTALHRVVIAALVGLLVLVVFRRSSVGLNGVATMLLAALAGVVGALTYARSAGVRRAVGWAAVAAPVVAVFFLVATPARALVLPGGQTSTAPLGEQRPPVVVVIFDELPVASLLAADRDLDRRNFPAFARLAKDSMFFRNMTTVHQQTSDAIPAALTGRYGKPNDLLPLASDHPDNLIALLADDYDLHVEEPITQLCPPGMCRKATAAPSARYRTLLGDLRVVALHAFLPVDLTQGLPPIDQGWTDFRETAAEQGKEKAVAQRFEAVRAVDDQGALFDRFVTEIERGDKPALHLIHMMLPHSPWRYLPDGRSYTDDGERPGMELGRWLADEWRVAHNYQRHLLQTQMVDRLLGKLLDRLEAQGIYDEAVIVVMGDHGISFTPDTSLRVLAPETFGEIAAVPFFIKLPGQDSGAVSDAPLELVDVLPTILDAMGAPARDGLDGRSAFDRGEPRTTKAYHAFNGELTFPAAGDEKWPTVERRSQLFGFDGPFGFPYDMAPEGYHRLLGTTVQSGGVPLPGVTASIDASSRYDDVDLQRDATPLLVRGVVESAGGAVPGVVAVAVNKRIAAVVHVDPDPVAARGFRALLPPDVVRPGSNQVDVLAVAPDGSLSPLTADG